MSCIAKPLGPAPASVSMINFRMLHARAAKMGRTRKQTSDMEKEYKYLL